MMEQLDKIVLSGLSALSLWLFRSVFTNNVRVSLLEQKLEQKSTDDERRHTETKAQIDRLVEVNIRAVDNQQRVLEQLIDKGH